MRSLKAKKRPSETKNQRKRPKDVWNSVRKLEGFLKKADIQASIFMDSLYELRDAVSLEVKSEIVKGLCSSVNGDILHALLEQKKRVEEGRDSGDIEKNAVMLGILDTLSSVLNLEAVGCPGERISVARANAKQYDFEEYPEALNDTGKKTFDVMILRPGWKMKETIVVKPKVFEAGPKKNVEYEIPDPTVGVMFVTSGGNGHDPGK